jgi:ribonuclease J
LIPVFIGETAAKILAASNPFVPVKFAPVNLRTYRDRETFHVGSFSVTPYLMDHSAYDAFAFLIEADGQRLWYSGDFRGHGRKSHVFERLVADPPRDLDVVLMEGTNVRPDGAAKDYPTEADLEGPLTQAFLHTEGMALVWASAQNIDRLVTIYKAARRAKRRFVIDFYTAQILKAIGNPNLPQPDWAGINVFLPESQRHVVLREELTETLDELKPRRMYLDRMKASLSDWVFLFRPSLLESLDASDCLVGSQLIYSLWPGYLNRPENQVLQARLASGGIVINHVHTSGHASIRDLQRLVAALKPRRVIPIHSSASERFPELFPDVVSLSDGEWFTLSGSVAS